MIDDKTLLQTDATIIAGVLILLTIYSLRYPVTRQAKIRRVVLSIVISFIIVPFGASAFFLISGDLASGLSYAAGGFIFIVVGIWAIIALPLLGMKLGVIYFEGEGQQKGDSLNDSKGS